MSGCKSNGGKSSKKNKGGKKSTKGQSDTKTITKKLETDRSIMMLIRSCLFKDNGEDKLDFGLPPILLSKTFDGKKVTVEFKAKIAREDFQHIFAMIKDGEEDIYDDCGYGWDDQDKKAELSERGGRFAIGRVDGEVVCFAHFRFTRAGEVFYNPVGPAAMHVYDIVVEESMRRKGVGKYLVSVLTMIAKKERLPVLTFPVYEDGFEKFLNKVVKGQMWSQAVDDMFGDLGGLMVDIAANDEGFSIYTKIVNPPFVPQVAPVVAPVAVPTPAPVVAPKATTPVKKVEVVAETSPSSVAIPPTAPTSTATSKLATFDMSAFTEGLEDEDSTIPSDSLDSEEGDLLESLIEEFVKRNDREPTEDEMQQWRDALREASEEALQAKFKNPTEEAGVELSAE
ncbi:hypothetical protein TrST_g7397 [Triparma strigata]|uniref:N-alpha-acetyltransferase 40 n=1 Tax=Triparma strigata TaxID=1606541 RepID=A0A9W7AFA9_9STRA|nr:hypothetical protein TrST_g7397 [Triparma strigata]